MELLRNKRWFLHHFTKHLSITDKEAFCIKSQYQVTIINTKVFNLRNSNCIQRQLALNKQFRDIVELLYFLPQS